jgi:hypothetical protein
MGQEEMTPAEIEAKIALYTPIYYMYADPDDQMINKE